MRTKITAFLNEQPPAVSGEGGHDQLFAVACALVRKFKLSVDDAWPLLGDYNRRCEPPWLRADLIHKLADAYKTIGLRYSEAVLGQRLPKHVWMGADKINRPIVDTGADLRPKPNRTGFEAGTKAQLAELSELRGIQVEGLRWAQERGVLKFGVWHGHPVFGVTDDSGEILELRRLDGQLFPATDKLSPRKSHAVFGSRKHHPVGIAEAADYPCIALVEGVPDFLAAHAAIIREQGLETARCAPVAMLSASVSIDPAALPGFKGKLVRIFYHQDANNKGREAARRWQQQIVKAGAWCCDLFDFKRVAPEVKDFNEYLIALTTGIPGGVEVFPK